MRSRRILILGGTRDARLLSDRLVGDGHDVTTSLAGVTSRPAELAGTIRTGGFGGSGGLADYLSEHKVECLIDATHPFAAQIGRNAAAAAERTHVPFYRLERRPWRAAAGDRWSDAGDTDTAVSLLEPGAVALVTIGRKEIAAFAGRDDVRVVARMIEPPPVELPAAWRVILARPPFSLDDEIALMRKEQVSVVVSKNAGGPGRAKLDAARQLGLPVIMIARPKKPAARVFETADELANAIGGEE